MNIDSKLLLIGLSLLLLAPASCPRRPPPEVALDDATLARHATIGPFQAQAARVINDSDAAFAEKLRLASGARSSIDMLYYVYHDDYSSAVFSKALLAAVSRGVDVRLLVDYNKCYRYLDYYTMLEKEAASGPGSLEVRLYNRPTRRLIEDAVYMTLGCSEVESEGGDDCDDRKFETIERAFAEEGEITNLNLANSGLFLSGLYAWRPQAVALAVVDGQNLDLDALKGGAQGSGERLESVKKLARIYWRSRNGHVFKRVVNQIKLALVYLRYGRQIRQLKETVTSLLPIGRSGERGGWRDWEHQSDYLHHKLLLVDGEELLTGGRNIGDQYHLRPHPLLEGHRSFADAEIYLELDGEQGREFRRTFDQLWDFRLMVAATAEVRQHAPNDFVANRPAFEAAAAICAGAAEAERETCVDREFAARALDLEGREATRRDELSRQASKYETDYSPAPEEAVPAIFEVDPGARMYYLEDLPWDKDLPPAERTRLYGARGLEEEATGKYLHLLWRRSLTNACLSSSAGAPQRVILHNAYYLPPATLLRAAGWMVDGTLDCRHVRVQVLSNSMETTNFQVINPVGNLGIKAFTDFYRQQGDPEKRARFEFWEYRVRPENESFTLHTKVSILGDDVLVGSANLDVRSYIMDTNNGVLIRDAPGLRDAYTAFVDAQLADPRTVTDLGASLRETSLEEVKSEELRRLSDFVGSFGIAERLSPEQQALLEGVYATILNQVYDLTYAVLSGDEAAIDRYNRLFQLL